MRTGWFLGRTSVVSRSFLPRVEYRTLLPLTRAFVTRRPVRSRTIVFVSCSTLPVRLARAESRLGPIR